MTLLLRESVFCLLPSLLFLLLLVAVRVPAVYACMGQAARAVGLTVWRGFCLLLHLPLRRISQPRTSMHDSEGTPFLCKPSTLAQYLQRHCGSLSRPTLAPWPKGDPHLQTVQALLCGPYLQKLQFSRDHLLLKDGGIIALDWVVGAGHSEVNVRRKYETNSPPVLLLIPQHWGGLSIHLSSLCNTATSQGFYVVVFHHRGTAGCPLTTTRLTEFGDSADFEQAVMYVHSRHPSSVLLAVSEGSGSGILVSYLGDKGSSSCLTAAAAISPVLQGQLWYETALPSLYHWGLLYHHKQQLRRYASSFRNVLDVDYVLKSSSIREFEQRLFCSSQSEGQWGLAPSATWELRDRARPAEDWDSYWERNEPLRDADEVAVPLLCICSRDDPLVPPVCSPPLSLFQSNPYFMLKLTDTGGHCGFTLQSSGNQSEHINWSHLAVLEYLRVTMDFLKGGEKDVGICIGPTGDLRMRTNTLASGRKRRATATRRSQNQTSYQSLNETEEFTWKRSYTR